MHSLIAMHAELKHEELSSWKEEWEVQVYQIHGSKMSEHIDGVTPMKGLFKLEQLLNM